MKQATKKEIEIKKAFGGCEHCFGKGYSSQLVKESTKVNGKIVTKNVIVYRPCTCLRGIEIHKMLKQERQLGRETFYNDANKLLPEFIEKEYPKGKKGRGLATVHIALFLTYIKEQI